jgi:hypothetical protein
VYRVLANDNRLPLALRLTLYCERGCTASFGRDLDPQPLHRVSQLPSRNLVLPRRGTSSHGPSVSRYAVRSRDLVLIGEVLIEEKQWSTG